MTLFDFKDGNGLVPAHKHSNGGGWVAESANVSEGVYVGSDAVVYGNAILSDWVKLYANAKVFGNAWLTQHVMVSGNAQICGTVKICGYVHITSDTIIDNGVIG